MKNIIYYYDLLIEEATTLVQCNEMSENTLRHYKCRKKIFLQYLATLRQTDIECDKISLLWVKKFELYLLPKYGTRNCVNKHIQTLSKALRYAVMNNAITHNPVRDYQYKYERRNNLNYLTDTELAQLQQTTLEPHLERVKDCFLFQCYTGLSYADLKAFDMAKNVIDNKHGTFILIARAKTAVDSAIPVMIDTLNILKKYNGTLPVLSNQKYNEYIKTMLKKCGINKTLSSHAARKTFAMLTHNTYAVPIDTVSKMLGHASVQTTQHYYAKTDFEKIAQDMHLMARVKKVA